MVANIVRVGVEVAERADYRTELSDTARVKQLSQPQPLRMTADHECFADLDTGARTHGEQSFSLRYSQAERLLAKHVLARFSRLNGPRHVQVVGQGDVNGVDCRVGEQLFIRSVRGGDAQSFGCFLGPGQIARSDGSHTGVLALQHARQNLLEADVGGTENSPANLLRHESNHNRRSFPCDAEPVSGISLAPPSARWTSASLPIAELDFVRRGHHAMLDVSEPREGRHASQDHHRAIPDQEC